jgi:Tfp pilus assembly protein PilV
VAVLVLLVAAIAGYAFHERNVVRDLSAQNSAMTSTLNKDQMKALNSRLDALSVRKPGDKPGAAHAFVNRNGVTAASTHHRIEDPRWKKMQGQLDEQGKQIDSTRQDLASTRTELQGSIAMTHDELVLLEKRGERNYFEFDLDKSGQFQREGSVGVRLRKANTKHEYADLELLVDDFKVSKKHVNIYEPVVSYSGDRKMQVELVINSISKNHIHGYISEPKYKSAELEAMAKPVNNSSTATNASVGQTTPEKPSPVREKLPPPNNN